ncbi:hypothetical protein ACFT5B_18105 [Luteimicrobium sp. NPDC057192]|uniref:hypothetical protein n=1 Tax=Luteimicrobium sp. NPDC057192 TaxID=3346042 RepID=UPI003634B369
MTAAAVGPLRLARRVVVRVAGGAGLVAVTACGYALIGVVAYGVLVVLAMLTGKDPGGPLAGPLLVLLAAVFGGLGVVVVLVVLAVVRVVPRLRSEPPRALRACGVVLLAVATAVGAGLASVDGWGTGVVAGSATAVALVPAWGAVGAAVLGGSALRGVHGLLRAVRPPARERGRTRT